MPLMSDRDTVCLLHKQDLPDGGTYISAQSIDRPDHPPVKGVVRMHMSIQAMYHQDKDDPTITNLTEVDNFDFKGYLPKRLVNMSMASEAAKEMGEFYKNLRIKQ